MRKGKNYNYAALDANAFSTLFAYLEAHGGGEKADLCSLSVRRGSETWQSRSTTDFLAEIRRGFSYASVILPRENLELWITCWNRNREQEAEFAVEGKDREASERFFEKIEEVADRCRVTNDPQPQKPTVFIGHGRSPLWRELKDHLVDKHTIHVEAFEVGSRSGHTIRDILDDMLARSSIAFLVLTGEDEGVDGALRARENVIHELGLFQGRLGFARAIALLEQGTNEFSNLHGIQQIRFTAGNIREVFGEVLAVIHREFAAKNAKQDKEI